MRFFFVVAALCCAVIGGVWVASASGQEPVDEVVYVPASSVEHPGDAGRKAHTNHVILLHNHGAGVSPLAGGRGSTLITPQRARVAYGEPGLPLPSSGGSGVIAIVDAYDYPSATADFNAFSAQFGLPQDVNGSVLQVVYARGSKPAYDSGWSQEAALDIEWAHAMAPNAQIVLVEAASSSFTDLLQAVDVASSIPGVKEVSMSWGSTEFASETAYDSHFPQNNSIVYFAASGDTGGQTNWPSVSPGVVSAGGTTLKVDTSGNVLSETGWSSGGGGASAYEPRPSYQAGIAGIVGSRRGTPDISFDADPNTGVYVYWQGGWYAFGGTSVSTPSLAGIVNLASSQVSSSFAGSSTAELTRIYGDLTRSLDFRDITSGRAGHNRCATGWDFVTGWGSNQGVIGK